MSIQKKILNTNTKDKNQQNEIYIKEIPKSNGFVYMDMKVYNEDEDSIHNLEEKAESQEQDVEENLPLYSVKNLAYNSDNENQTEVSKDTNSKTKTRKDHFYESDLGQKENLSSNDNDSDYSSQKRYRLRTRGSAKNVSSNGFEITTKNLKPISLKEHSACNKCDTAFSDKTQLSKHKKEKQNFKCSSCKKYFCSNSLLKKHMKMCKVKLLKGNKHKFSCEKCEQVFTDKSEFEFHLSAHHELLFKCQKCKKIFTEKSQLEYHVFQNLCGSLRVYTCDICKQTFSQMNLLRRHIMGHMNKLNHSNLNKNYSSEKNCASSSTKNICHICNKSYLQERRLKIHLLQHQGISYKCSKCSKLFLSQESLDNHSRGKNCFISEQKCMKCGKVYKDNASFQKHLETHKNDLMNCSNCNKVFIEESKFSDHLNKDCQKPVGKKKLRYECDACGSTFNKVVKLKIHILNVHQGINYQCEKCKRQFTCQEDMDAHATKDCKFEEQSACKICGKVFAKKNYLTKHLYMHSNVIFKCKYCYCAFMKEKNYKRHVEKMNCSKSARKIRMAEFNFKKCRICEMEFETEELLIQHFDTSHAGEKPHQCFCCEMCLPSFQDLQNHIHHHNIQKYTCSLCGKAYTSQEGFRKHRLKHKGAEFKCKFCESEFLNESRFKFHETVCKKNPESGYQPSEEKEKSKKKDGKPKQRRQLHWESRIIMKHLRGDPQASIKSQLCVSESKNENSVTSTFFGESETETTNERGWFDNYYKTEEDDIAFGLKKENETPQQDSDLEFDVNEFLRMGPTVKNRKTSPPLVEPQVEDHFNDEVDNCTESSSTDSSSESTDEAIEEIDLPIDYNPKKCRLCIIVFGQEYELLHHFIKTHPGEYAHKCPHCEVQSPLFAQLKEHMKNHGIGIGVYNCDNCSKKFRSEKKMKSHNIRCKGMNLENSALDSKKNPLPWEELCKKCGKKFHTKFGYRRHKQVCKGKKDKSKKTVVSEVSKTKEESFTETFMENEFPLSDGEESDKDKLDLQNNVDSNVQAATIMQVNPEADKPEDKLEDRLKEKPNAELEDKSKDKPEEKKTELKDSYVGEPPIDSFPCRLCDKKFQYERGLVMHFKSFHPGNKPLICHVCKMFLADKLKEHLKTHGIGEEFVCELCGKRFNQKFLSKIHEMWHQGIEYKCSNCKQKFLNKEKMDKHVGENRCSNRQSLMRLPCHICGKSYRSKFGLNKHLITHTPKELRPVKNRMNCEYCGKWFDNNNGLQRHRRIHTGERPFCCRFCPKAFAQEGNCKAHERIHTGESKPRKKKIRVPMPLSPSPPPPPPPPSSPPLPPPPPPVPVPVSVPVNVPVPVTVSVPVTIPVPVTVPVLQPVQCLQPVPAVPVLQAPAMPVLQAPAVPVLQAPAVPVLQAPAMPVLQAPAVPVLQAPAVPVLQAPAVPVLQAPAPPVIVDSISYPPHMNFYIFNNIDPNGIVH